MTWIEAPASAGQPPLPTNLGHPRQSSTLLKENGCIELRWAAVRFNTSEEPSIADGITCAPKVVGLVSNPSWPRR